MARKVILFATGGTIAMRHDPEKGGEVPAVGGAALVEAVPPLKDLAIELEVAEFSSLSSFHMTPDIMLRLALEIEKALANPEVEGVVVTHGTDTIEETAYFVDLFLAPEKPVCFTGAMRSGSDISSDGPFNVYCAVLAASSPRLRGHGAVVVMNGEIHSAAHVTKTHTSAVQTFASLDHGPLGHIYKNTLFVECGPAAARAPLRPKGAMPQVAILRAYTGMDSTLLDMVLEAGVDGLVVEGFGKGNFPAEMAPGIERALAAGIPVVAASRVPAGRVMPVYADVGGAEHLRSIGVMLAGGLNSQKARLLLMLAMGVSRDSAYLKGIFAGV